MFPSPARITTLDTHGIRFPTSRESDGSDAMNPDPDYSAACPVLRTDAADGPEGHGFVFTIGRGNDVQTAAIEALRPYVTGLGVAELRADPGVLSRALVGDGQLRWLGPEKGGTHMAIGAVVTAVWGLAAKRAGKPLWKFLADADHLHEHFLAPAAVRGGCYTAPTAPGFSAQPRPESIAAYAYPAGSFWAGGLATDTARAGVRGMTGGADGADPAETTVPTGPAGPTDKAVSP